MVLWTTFFFSSISSRFLVVEKNLPGSGSGWRFLAGSKFNEYGSETLKEEDKDEQQENEEDGEKEDDEQEQEDEEDYQQEEDDDDEDDEKVKEDAQQQEPEFVFVRSRKVQGVRCSEHSLDCY